MRNVEEHSCIVCWPGPQQHVHCACLDKVFGASVRAVYGPAVARCLLPFKQHMGSGAELPSAEDAEKPCFIAEVPPDHQ